MPSLRRPTLLLMLSAFSFLAPGCAQQVRIQPIFPLAADLAVERDCPATDPRGVAAEAQGRHCKPIPSADIVTSAHAAADFDVAVQGWGQRGWNAVARLCRWARAQGAAVDCPAP